MPMDCQSLEFPSSEVRILNFNSGALGSYKFHSVLHSRY